LVDCMDLLLQNTAPGAGMAGVGGRSGPAVPADRGGLHPEGRNKVKELSAAQLAARRGGTRG